MDLIPVIDVAKGRVVRALKGQRANYRPIITPLNTGDAPADVALGLCRLFRFRSIYVADLDGIAGRGRNVHLVPQLSRALGDIDIWVDAGTASRGAARAILAAPVTTLVVGSESMETHMTAIDIMAEAPHRTVLSLDFRDDEFMGPQALLDDPTLWPARVIVMTLARVGSEDGPDIARLRHIIKQADGRKVYAAGGVRNRADIDTLRQVGAAGALISSALHAQKITAGDLQEISGRPKNG